MLLKAKKDIPTHVNTIPAGDLFHELDPDRQAYWIGQGFAEIYNVPPNTPVLEFPDWSGSTAVIVASGESLTPEQCHKVEAWQGPMHRVVAINTSFNAAPFADILYACDRSWWDAKNEESGLRHAFLAAQHFSPNEMWTQDADAAKEYGIKHIKSAVGKGLNKKKYIVNQGQNSTYQAMNLLYHAGVKKIILLGVDCKGGHWHNNHPPSINRAMPHAEWKRLFADLARDLKSEGVEVVNCSPGTALKAFPLGDLDEELAK